MEPLDKIFYSRGKLMISGEYFVLAGAKSLSVPLKVGQQMEVKFKPAKDSLLHWKTDVCNNPWFKANYALQSLDIIKAPANPNASYIKKLLEEIKKANPGIFSQQGHYHISCCIEFNPSWGWGSSSSLLANLAQWAGVNPYELNTKLFNGSGYDIATSLSNKPIFYNLHNNKRDIQEVNFLPGFHDHLYFIYLGKKQSSATSIEKKANLIKENTAVAKEISELSEKLAREQELPWFMNLMSRHEEIISKTLNMPKVRDKYFHDFHGDMKSLGAWGGDFVLAATEMNKNEVKNYFHDKGLETIFTFDQIVNYEETRKSHLAKPIQYCRG